MFIVDFYGKRFEIEEGNLDNLGPILEEKLGICSDDFYFQQIGKILHFYPRIRGGKGGFGRAMKQEGERRSRRLPPHKDASRTLSGHRIGYLKAKKQIVLLRQKLKEMQDLKEKEKQSQRSSNQSAMPEEIASRVQKTTESVESAFLASLNDDIDESAGSSSESE